MKKRLLTLALACVMVFSVAVPTYAASGETVYVILENDLGTKSMSAVNGGVQTDNLSGELPFNLSILYYLDKKPVKASEIVGKSGDAKVVIEVVANAKAAPYYRENLALQMQFPLDIIKNTNITAPGLSGVTVGNTNTLSGMVMPGKSGKFEISFKTDKFELGSINFVAMPFDVSGAAGVDISTIGGDVKKLQEGIGAYVDGVSKLSSGANSAKKGMKELADGAAGIEGGYTQVEGGYQQLMASMLQMLPPEAQAAMAPQIEGLKNASAQFGDALSAYTGGVAKASGGVSQLSSGIGEMAKQGGTLKSSINDAIAPLTEMVAPPTPTNSTPVSFVSGGEVGSIQFVMKTDALKVVAEKVDIVPEKAEKSTFWQRLTALFK